MNMHALSAQSLCHEQEKEIAELKAECDKYKKAFELAFDFVQDVAFCNSKIRIIHFSGASAPWINHALDTVKKIEAIKG